MMKVRFNNRKGLEIVAEVLVADHQKGLAFVLHGLGGFKEQPHIQTIMDAFADAGYTVVAFDTTNSIGESGGRMEDASVTNSFEDLQDVIDWAATQSWYQEPFMLAGHSLGGISVSLYAAHFPEKVKGVAPVSSIVSGQLSLEAYDEEEIRDWKRTGWQVRGSRSRPGVIKRIPWSHMEDRFAYNLLSQADRLTMSVLLIVGELDDVTPPEHQRMLYDALPGENKSLVVIDGAPHTFREELHLRSVNDAVRDWLSGLTRKEAGR